MHSIHLVLKKCILSLVSTVKVHLRTKICLFVPSLKPRPEKTTSAVLALELEYSTRQAANNTIITRSLFSAPSIGCSLGAAVLLCTKRGRHLSTTVPFWANKNHLTKNFDRVNCYYWVIILSVGVRNSLSSIIIIICNTHTSNF